VFFVIVFVLVARAIRIIRENQRVVVFRLGRFVGVRGPGLIYVVPFVDKTEQYDLNKWVPDWQTLSREEVEEKIRSVALSQPDK
jgi:regulator of protease activity HflC (stomatin/prohibitin superfamily)